MIDYPLIIAENDTRKRVSVDITSDSIKVIKFLRAVQIIDSKDITMFTFHILMDECPPLRITCREVRHIETNPLV